MKTFLPAFFIFQFCFNLETVAQNLVPDPSFEILKRIPEKRDNAVTCTKYWMCPTHNGYSDYYHRKAKWHAGVPRNIFGRQKPHSGNAYAGVCIRKKFIEYLATKLTDTLEKDQEYLIEFYISRAERSLGSVKEFGVLFTEKINMGIRGIGIDLVPSVGVVKRRGYRKKRKWMKFSAVYRAEGYETAIILGYFNYDKSKKFRGYSHYYIDDVTISPLAIDNVVSEEIEKKTEEEVLPSSDEALPTFSPKMGEVITLDKIFFNLNESDLLTESYYELDKLLQYLIENPNKRIKISGHTDNTGNENQNVKLSVARAKAVADYLISNAIEEERIGYFGYGSAKPLITNDTEDGRKQNRRVEFVMEEK